MAGDEIIYCPDCNGEHGHFPSCPRAEPLFAKARDLPAASLIQCHRCDCAFEDGTGYAVTVDGKVSRAVRVCQSCASFIAAAIDGRPLFSRGLKAKYDTCLEDG